MILRGLEIVGEGEPLREIVVSGSLVTRVDDVSTHVPREGPVVELGEAIAFPGLTNSHDHLEFNVYPALGHRTYSDYVEWGHDIQRRDANVIAARESVPRRHRLRWGALKNLLCGVTAVAHHGDAHDDLGCLPIDAVGGTSIHSVAFGRHWRRRLNAPVDRSPYVFHIGEGTSLRARREVGRLIRWNLFRRGLIGVHAIAMRAEQAAHFRAVVWCPVSNEFLYGSSAPIETLKHHTTVLFGTDSTLTGDWNIWNHLRRARTLGALDDRELFAAVTHAAASTWRRPTRGRLAPGQTADLVVARKKAESRWDAFFAVDPQDILLVLRAGRVALRDASLDVPTGDGRFSLVRIGASEKWVAEDVRDIIAAMRRYGVEPNLPIVPLGGRRDD